jgi:SulP family sulfate permease
MAQGLAKLASAFSGSFATSTSFSRSAHRAVRGSPHGWVDAGDGGFVLLALLFFTPLLYHVPRAVLAAVVIAAVAGLLKPGAFGALWRMDRCEARTALVTFGVTLLSAPRIYWGVLAGVLMGPRPLPVPPAAPAHH